MVTVARAAGKAGKALAGAPMAAKALASAATAGAPITATETTDQPAEMTMISMAIWGPNWGIAVF